MVKNLFRTSTEFLFRKQTNILSAATVIAATVLLSRLLGLVKLRMLTDQFSVTDLGVFWAAFRLPNTIFDIIVMGALTAAFIPVFTTYINKEKYEEANRIASTILNVSIILLLALSVVFFFFAGELITYLAPGLSAKQSALATDFTRIMLIGQTLPLVLGNFLTGILQSYKRFLIPALAPIAYNIGIILGIFFLSPVLGLYAPVWGTVLGACFFLIIQIPLSLHLKFTYRPVLALTDPGVREIGRLIGPRAFGLAVAQLNYMVNLIISSLIATRAIAIFNFAQQLEQLPVSIFAATISQAALPTLSEEKLRDDSLETFKKTFLTSFHQILFLVLPAAAILIVLRIPIVRLVYGASKFDWPATVDTGHTLAFLGLGIMAESVNYLLIRGFFALHDSKSPVLLSALCVVINIGLSLLLIPVLHLPIWGLGLSAATSDSLCAIALLFFLNRKVGGFSLPALLVPGIKMFLAAGLTGIALYAPMKLLDQLVFDTTRTIPLLALTSIATLVGLTVYALFTWALQIDELNAFIGLFRKIKRLIFSAEESMADVVAQAVTVPPTTAQDEKH